MNSFSFICLKESLFCLHFLEIFSLGTEFYVDGFSSRTLKMQPHCLPLVTVSDKWSAVILIFASLFLFLLSASEFFNLLFFKQFDYQVPWCSFLHVSCVWGLLNFLDLWVYSFHQIWKCLSHYFFKYFFCHPPLGTPSTHIFGHLQWSHNSKMFL